MPWDWDRVLLLLEKVLLLGALGLRVKLSWQSGHQDCSRREDDGVPRTTGQCLNPT